MKKLLILLLISLLLISCNLEASNLNKEALKLMGVKRFDEAIELLEEALELDDTNDEIWNSISYCYDAVGKYQLALDAAKKAVELGDVNEIEYSNLGNAYYDLGQTEEAKKAFEKSLEIKDDYFYSLYGLGVYYSNLEQYDKALEYFNNLNDNNPQSPDVLKYLAFCKFKTGKIEEAITLLETKLEFTTDKELEDLLETLYDYKKAHENDKIDKDDNN